MDQCNNNNLASTSFDIMNEPLIPTQTIDTVMLLNTSTETTINECDNFNDYKHKHDNVANSNADFDLKLMIYLILWIARRKMMLLQPTLVTPDLIEDKAINAVLPSIPAISNNILNTSRETTTNKYDNLNDDTFYNNIANFNADFDLNIDNLSDFMDSTDRNDALYNLLS